TIWAVSATLCVVDGAHYTERLFNCKPLSAKNMIFFTSGGQNGVQGSIQGLSWALYSRKFPVSWRLCQTNPHIDKVKTL
ncbi:hypothetical protein QIW46_04025, partial [Pseudomonas fluorescens]|uniref:hypothetical protein n=1 Tax=Pseudomonas fluorescens TaxID=294 RepID=UPI0035261238